jgi:DNA-binding beta-propeller fold protein YncE
MKNNVKTISLCLGLASLALGQTTTAPIYQMSILAGIPTPNALGDNGPSVFGIVSSPQGIALDKSGNIFIADNNNNKIRRIDATTGVITTWATGNVSGPSGITLDSKGDIIVLNNGNDGQVLRIPFTSTGAAGATTIITNPQAAANTYGSDGDYAYSAWLNSPNHIALDANDDMFIADSSNNRVRMIKNVNGCMYNAVTTGNNQVTTTCHIITIAGSSNTPQFGTSCGANNTCTPAGTNTVGDGGPALAARVQGPFGIAVTPDGSMVYVAQNGDHRIRSINMNTGIINTVIGNCTSSTASSNNVAGGNPYVIPCPSGSFGSASANGTNASVSTLGDGKLAVNATTNSPRGLFLDSVNNILYFADGGNHRIRAINLATGIVNTVVGSGSSTATGDQGSGLNSGLLTSVGIGTPYAVAVQNGLIYWVEQDTNKVRVADPVAQIVKTLVNQPRSSGSGGPATNAYLGFPTSLSSSSSPRVAVDAAGNVYITESATNRVRKVGADGTIVDWAGTGASGSTGDGGPAAVARLNNPQQVAFDSAGNGYITDSGNNKIRKVDTSGNITTVVGRAALTCTVASSAAGCVPDKSDYVGDGGAATNARLSSPQGIAVDSSGNLIIADTGHNSIRLVNTSGVITTIAGGIPVGVPNGPTDGRSGLGSSGYQDSTNAMYGLFNTPRAVAVDGSGNIYISEYTNPAGRELIPVNPATGSYQLITMYGSGNSSGTAPSIPTGTGLASVPARIRMSSNNATSIAVDPGGNIYYALPADNRVNVVSADHTKIYEVAGGGTSDTGLNYTSSNGLNLQLPNVTGVAVDSNGVVYTADRTGLVRKLVCTKNCLPLK